MLLDRFNNSERPVAGLESLLHFKCDYFQRVFKIAMQQQGQPVGGKEPAGAEATPLDHMHQFMKYERFATCFVPPNEDRVPEGDARGSRSSEPAKFGDPPLVHGRNWHLIDHDHLRCLQKLHRQIPPQSPESQEIDRLGEMSVGVQLAVNPPPRLARSAEEP